MFLGLGVRGQRLKFPKASKHFATNATEEKSFAQRGARTHDPEIKSLMLYRLS